ncbi:MAG: hypothetical protein J6U54_15420 [Clostridiales bacterium]|nr:hypothetical protein [Clostridiales bacterium]
MKRSSKLEDRESTYQMLYTKVSKATAEVDGKKQVYDGRLTSLFDDVPVSSTTITQFVWAISHKTDALPTTLFSIKKTGKGVAIERLHSGFYDNSGKHIVGKDLVPFIMRAMALYQPKANKARGTRTAKKQEVADNKLVEAHSIEVDTDLIGLSEDALASFGKDAKDRLDKANADLDRYTTEVTRREIIRQKQQKLQDVLELMEMNKDELKELLNI